MRKVSSQLMALIVLAGLCVVIAPAQDAGAPAQPQGQPAAQQGPRTDGQIEMDVVHALDGSAALKNDLITAATIQSEVTLSGTVSSDASKQLAESIALHVGGVTKVHDNLQIGNPGADAQNPQPAPGPAMCRIQTRRRRNSKWRTCRRQGLRRTRIRSRIRPLRITRRLIRNSRATNNKMAILSKAATHSRAVIRNRAAILPRGRSIRIRRIPSIRRTLSRRPRISLPEVL